MQGYLGVCLRPKVDQFLWQCYLQRGSMLAWMYRDGEVRRTISVER